MSITTSPPPPSKLLLLAGAAAAAAARAGRQLEDRQRRRRRGGGAAAANATAARAAGAAAAAGAVAENKLRRSCSALMLFERVCSTSWKSFVAVISCVFSESTTLSEWLARCFAPPRGRWRCACCSSFSRELSAVMSCLMMNVSALISCPWPSSSKSERDCASCVSLPSLSATAEIALPICEAAAANSVRPRRRGMVGGGADDEEAPCRRDWRSAMMRWNSAVRSMLARRCAGGKNSVSLSRAAARGSSAGAQSSASSLRPLASPPLCRSVEAHSIVIASSGRPSRATTSCSPRPPTRARHPSPRRREELAKALLAKRPTPGWEFASRRRCARSVPRARGRPRLSYACVPTRRSRACSPRASREARADDRAVPQEAAAHGRHAEPAAPLGRRCSSAWIRPIAGAHRDGVSPVRRGEGDDARQHRAAVAAASSTSSRRRRRAGHHLEAVQRGLATRSGRPCGRTPSSGWRWGRR